MLKRAVRSVYPAIIDDPCSSAGLWNAQSGDYIARQVTSTLMGDLFLAVQTLTKTWFRITIIASGEKDQFCKDLLEPALV